MHLPSTDPAQIKINPIAQLTSPVRWTQTVENMIKDGARIFTEVGGKVLQGLVKKLTGRWKLPEYKSG
jgi:[acyl-carrier-protein] S-malonyltransferase